MDRFDMRHRAREVKRINKLIKDIKSIEQDVISDVEKEAWDRFTKVRLEAYKRDERSAKPAES